MIVIRALFLTFTLVLFACSNEKINEQELASQKRTEQQIQNSQKLEIKPINVIYSLVAAADTLNWLQSLKNSDTLNALLYINRVDQNYLTRLDTIVIPDIVSSNLNIYCPFPENLGILKEVNKIILVSYNYQAFGVYECGKRIRWGPTSLGKESTPTPKGLFFTNWKSKKTYSTIDSTWVLEWYFNFANFDGVSLHEYSLPGYPASHSCVRLFRDDAYWFYYWADQWMLNDNYGIKAYGTPLLVYGNYPFEGRKPWMSQVKNSWIVDKNEIFINQELLPHISLILERQKHREGVIKAKTDSLHILI